MTIVQEMKSWIAPPSLNISPAFLIRTTCPSHPALPLPDSLGQPAIIVFLRHCGCPFAEKAYLDLCNLPTIRNNTIIGLAVSHSSIDSTNKWLDAIHIHRSKELPQNGMDDDSPTRPRIVIDESRELYARWGLGIAPTWHVINPQTIYAAVSLGIREGIWDRPTESGNRWQRAGSFAVDREGIVRWVHVPALANELGDLGEVEEVLMNGVSKE